MTASALAGDLLRNWDAALPRPGSSAPGEDAWPAGSSSGGRGAGSGEGLTAARACPR